MQQPVDRAGPIERSPSAWLRRSLTCSRYDFSSEDLTIRNPHSVHTRSRSPRPRHRQQRSSQQHRQPTAVPVYSDQLAGSQAYFQVITDDTNWELVVVSGTS
jgi:hypothetical protein